MTAAVHSLQCACGELQGSVDLSGISNRLICYCKDCQFYAKFVNDKILDDYGGSEIIQVSPSRVRFAKGVEHFAAVRLTDRGIIRWYAKCCNTPIGNTGASHKLSFIGLVHACMDAESMDAAFGKIKSRANTKNAVNNCPLKDSGLFGVICRFIAIAAYNRLTGRYKINPFFTEAGRPIVEPRILQ